MRFLFAMIVLLAGSPMAAQQVPQSAAQIQLSFAPLVRETAPAVVNIYAKVIRQVRRSPFRGDPFFERFFEEFGTSRSRVQNSLGSGVILSANGIVVSNFHVVGNASDIRVVLADRREYAAEVLLGDAASDLAILKLKGADGLPFLKLKSSDAVEVGELVLAVGNPFGVGQTVSSGIVSGLARSAVTPGSKQGYFIQTDAPINPGNSGGALIGMDGQLVGINTSILTRSGGSNGIGFAIPADLVKAFVAQAEEGRSVFARPWSGIAGQALDAEMAEAFGLGRPGGIVLSVLHEQSPFAEAGLLPGDVVMMIDDQPVNALAEMTYRMTVSGSGQSITVRFLRDGWPEEASVMMREAPDFPARDERILARRQVLPGMRVARVNPAVISEFGLALDAVGVLIVDPERLGRRVGLQRGDVIEAINARTVAHPDDVARIFAEAASRYVLTVLRGDRRLSIRFRV